MDSNDLALTQSILDQIDVLDLIERIGFATEKKRTLGNSLKAPCMIHKDASFASLIIDLDKKTFKCMKSSCAAHQGGNLLDLYSLYSGKSGMAATFALAVFMGLSLDDSAAEEVFESHRASAYEAVEQSDRTRLALEIQNIEEIRKNFPGISLLKAELEALNPDADSGICSDLWQQAIIDLSHQQNHEKALEIFETRFADQKKIDEEFLELVSDLYLRSGNESKQIEITLSLIESTSDINRKLVLFAKIPESHFVSNPALLIDFASCNQLSENTKKAEELFLQAAKIAQENNRSELELEVHESLFRIDPKNPQYLEALIECATRREAQGRAAEFLKKQCEYFLDSEQFEIVLNPMKKCLELDASDPEKWELAATLFEMLDDPKGRCDALLNCIGLMKVQDYPEARIKEKLEACLELVGDDADLLEKTASVCHQVGDEKKAQELLERGIFLSEKNQNAEQLLIWLAMGLEWNPSDVRLHEQRLTAFQASAQTENWKSEALDLISLYDQNDEFTKSLNLISNLTEQFPKDSQVRVLWLKHQIGEGSSGEEELGLESTQLITEARKNKDRLLASSVMEAVKGTIAETTECRLQYAQLIHEALEQNEDVSSEELQVALRSTTVSASVLLAALNSVAGPADHNRTSLIIRSGRQSIEESHQDYALAVLEIIQQSGDNNFELMNLSADLAEFIGDTAQCVKSLRALTEYCLSEGRTKEAISSISHLLRHEENDAELLGILVELYRETNQDDKSIEVQIRLAHAHKANGNSQKAEGILEACQKSNPENIFVIRELAKSLAQNGKTQEAIESLKKVASILEQQNQISEALQTHLEILQLDESNSESRRQYLTLVAENQSAEKVDVALLSDYLCHEQEQISPAVRIRLFDFLIFKNELPDVLFDTLLKDIKASPELFSKSQLSEFGQFIRSQRNDEAAWPFYHQLSKHPDSTIGTLKDCLEVATATKHLSDCLTISHSLAKALQSENQLPSAVNLLESMDAEQRDVTLDQLLIELHLESNNIGKASDLQLLLIEKLIEQNLLEEAHEEVRKLADWSEEKPDIQEQCAEFSLKLNDKESAVNYYRSAVDCYQDHQPELAVEVIDQILPIVSNDASWLWKKSTILQDLDQFELAIITLKEIVETTDADEAKIDALTQVIALAPKDSDARRGLANLLAQSDQQAKASEHYQTLIQFHLKSDELHQAEIIVNEALETLDSHIDIQISRVDLLEKLDKLDECLPEFYEKILEINELGALESAELLLDKIRPFADQNNETYLRCLTLVGSEESKNEAVANAKYKLCQKMIKDGRIQEAIIELKDSISSGSDTAILRQELARLYTQMGSMEEARNEYLTLIRYLTDRGNIDQARRFVPTLISMDADNIHLREQIASIFLKNGIPEIASEQYLEIAKVVKEEKNLAEAIRWTQRALESTPRLIDARIFLAHLFEDSDDKQKATAQYVKAAELLIDSGAFTRGAELLERICRLMPESPEPREQLAKLFEQRGDIPRYIEQLEKLSKLYASLNRDDERSSIHQRLISTKPDDTRYRRNYIDFLKSKDNSEETFQNLMLLAKHFEQKGFWKDAISNYRQALSFATDQQAAFSSLLELLETYGTPEEYAREALKFIDLLLKDDNIPEAQMLLNRVSNVGQKMPEFFMAKASILAATNQSSQASVALTQAKELLENKGSFELKKTLLGQLVKLDPANISARRELIQLLQEHHQLEEAADNLWELANHYIQQDLIDLALAELRTLTKITPDDSKVWTAYFESQEKAGMTDVIPDDLMQYSELLLDQGQFMESLDAISRIIKSDPFHIGARIQYTRNYLKVGSEKDLIDDYLTLADLLVSDQRVDEALFFYDKVVTIDPDHRDAQLRMTQTQRKKRGRNISPKEITDPSTKRPHEAAQFTNRGDLDPLGGTNSAMAFLQNELSAFDEEDESDELRQVVDNYIEILEINPQNAIVRLKLTDLYLQLKDQESALDQLTQASEIFAAKGEIKQGIETCERILEINPNDQKTRLRLKQAINKRDAFKALESAIIFADHSDNTDDQ